MNEPTKGQIAAGCRHFNGVQNKVCKAGIEYAAFYRKGSIPCLPDEQGKTPQRCDQFAYKTVEELEEHDRQVAEAVSKWLKNFAAGMCPHCGRKIEQKKQVGRCVYAEPCGCRLYQGKLSDEGKGKKL